MKTWYGIQMLIENTYGNSVHDTAKHSNCIASTYGAASMGHDRWQRISKALRPISTELQDIAKIIELNGCMRIGEANVITVDESVIGYRPSRNVRDRADLSGNPIPLVYIKRKPHPNGLEIFLGCTYITSPFNRKGIPFVVLLELHLVVAGQSCDDVVRSMMARWDPKRGRVHWVVDAAFGSADLVKHAMNLGYKMTSSVAQSRIGPLWQALSRALPTDHWRAAYHASDRITASVHYGVTDGKREYQCVLSSNYVIERELQPQSSNGDANTGRGTDTVAVSVPGLAAAADTPAADDIPQQFRPDALAKLRYKDLADICGKLHNKKYRSKQMRIDIAERARII